MRARRLFAVVLSFVAAIAVFSATRGDERAAAGPPAMGRLDASPTSGRRRTPTRASLRCRRDVRAGRSERAAALADAYLQKVRETGDASFYTRADTLLRSAGARPVRRRRAGRVRHAGGRASRLPRRAGAGAPRPRRSSPARWRRCRSSSTRSSSSAATTPPSATLQRLVDLQAEPDRVRARVLHPRAVRRPDGRRRRDAAAPSARAAPVPENVAYVQALLGGLELERGRLGAARRAFDAALARDARLRAGRRRARAAGRRQRRPARRDRALAAGRRPAAAARVRRRRSARPSWPPAGAPPGDATSSWCARRRRCSAGAGVNTDVELAIFEADHGSPRAWRAARARAAWRNAPSIRSADALGWALTRAGRPEAGLRWAHRALRLGTLDPSLRYHAGMAALAAGRRAEGRRQLRAGDRARARRAAAASRAGAGGTAMKRAILLALLVLAVVPGVASAHPLGNFSVNHLAEVSVSADRVDVRYVLDQAEIPTFQERDCPTPSVLARKRAEVEKRLVLTVDGRRVPLAAAGEPVLDAPGRRRRAAHDAARAAAAGDGLVARARGGARRHVPGARRLARRRAAARRWHRGALGRAGRRSDRQPPQLSRRTHCRARPTCASRPSRSQPGDGTLDAPDGRRVDRAAARTATTCCRARSATPRPARACC